MAAGQRIPEQAAREVAEFYRAESSGLFNHARVLSQGDRAGAEDLVQTVFEAVMERWDSVGSRPAPDRRRWLFVVLRNKAVDKWREESGMVPDVDMLEGALGALPPENDPAEIVIKAINAKQLWEKLRVMPPAQYRVAYLSWRCGWTVGEMADALGIAQSTVRVHKHNATQQIRRMVVMISTTTDRGGEEDGGA